MDESDVRAHVLGLPTRTREGDREVLVERYTSGTEPFYRPIGGGVEFGEWSEDAVVREFREETGYAVTPERFLGVSENVYEFAGTPGHEVSLVWAVAFEREGPYDRERIRVEEGSGGERWATWHTPEALRTGPEPCYPVGVFDLFGDQARTTSD